MIIIILHGNVTFYEQQKPPQGPVSMETDCHAAVILMDQSPESHAVLMKNSINAMKYSVWLNGCHGLTRNHYAFFDSIAACAAASLAIGTLNGEQDT